LNVAPTLLLIDLQRAIDDPRWGRRNNPALEANVARLLAAWRERGWRVEHVAHRSTEPGSTYAPDGPGAPFKVEAAPRGGESVTEKRVHSALVGTDLEARLLAGGVRVIVVAGVITNNSVEATVRHAADLGFEVVVAADGCATFDKVDLDGRRWSAEEVHAMALANMSGEYARIATVTEILADR
jgi:nicotinamidase-related amidase